MKLNIRVLIPVLALTILAVGCSNPVGASMADYVGGSGNESDLIDSIEETDAGAPGNESDGSEADAVIAEPTVDPIQPVEKGAGEEDGTMEDEGTVEDGAGTDGEAAEEAGDPDEGESAEENGDLTDGEAADDRSAGNGRGRGRGNGNAYGLENGKGNARGFDIGRGHQLEVGEGNRDSR